eukprot:scaffold4438_cov56-Cyclotella_meneghiniana.AAC.12
MGIRLCGDFIFNKGSNRGAVGEVQFGGACNKAEPMDLVCYEAGRIRKDNIRTVGEWIVPGGRGFVASAFASRGGATEESLGAGDGVIIICIIVIILAAHPVVVQTVSIAQIILGVLRAEGDGGAFSKLVSMGDDAVVATRIVDGGIDS